MPIISAYFTIYIYGYELLEEALAKVGNGRFLFGDPTSVEDLDPGNSKLKSLVLTDVGEDRLQGVASALVGGGRSAGRRRRWS